MAKVRKTKQLQIFRYVCANGLYSYDPSGKILNNKGVELKLSISPSHTYPTVSFYVGVSFAQSIGRAGGSIAVSANRFAAYCLFGESAFIGNTQIRHLNGNVMDISKANLKLGDASSNMRDIPAHIRSAAARTARAAQPKRPSTAKLTDNQVTHIKRICKKASNGVPLHGEVGRIAKMYGVAPATISGILAGKIYRND